MIRLCHGRSHELMWSWGYGQCCPQQQWWRHHWMLVGDILNRRISEKSCTRGIGNISWNRQDSDHMKYTSPNYFGNLRPRFRVCMDFQGNIYWERCFSIPIVTYTIHRLQQTQLGTLHLSYCLSPKIGGHLEFCILKPGVHQNCNLHIKNWLSTL